MIPSPLYAQSGARLLERWDRAAFTVDGVVFHTIDAVLAAMARGDWSQFERRLSEGLACAAWAAGRRQPLTTDVDAAATAFRYARDLISAEEMNAWLAEQNVSPDEWTEFLRRDLLRQRPPEPIDDILESHQPSAARLIQNAVVEGVCSGGFEQYEGAFMRRVALATQASGGALSVADANVSEEEAARLLHTYAHWLSIRPAADSLGRARRILALEAAYDAAERTLLTQAALAEILDHHRLEWRVVETETVLFDSEPAAREAMLCVTDDRMSLQEVAALSHRPVDRQTRLVEEFEADPANPLLSADVGALVGPAAAAGGFAVSQVVRCSAPSLDEPRVATRARAAVIDRATVLAVRVHVRFAAPRSPL